MHHLGAAPCESRQETQFLHQLLQKEVAQGTRKYLKTQERIISHSTEFCATHNSSYLSHLITMTLFRFSRKNILSPLLQKAVSSPSGVHLLLQAHVKVVFKILCLKGTVTAAIKRKTNLATQYTLFRHTIRLHVYVCIYSRD